MTNWYDFVDVVEARAGIRTELSLERDGRTLTRFVTPESTMEDDPVTGERVRVGKVGIFRPAFERRDVSLVDFRNAVNSIVDRKTNIATVIHHLESDSIVAVHVVK